MTITVHQENNIPAFEVIANDNINRFLFIPKEDLTVEQNFRLMLNLASSFQDMLDK
ncbi:MAG: hypothetical protein IKJ88_07835 [Clostridia bacterium]|nr:hypothetical protein [Clostridia bacterium]